MWIDGDDFILSDFLVDESDYPGLLVSDIRHLLYIFDTVEIAYYTSFVGICRYTFLCARPDLSCLYTMLLIPCTDLSLDNDVMPPTFSCADYGNLGCRNARSRVFIP